MADSVPDPDEVMEADVHDMIADEPDEPFQHTESSSFYVDGNNSNHPEDEFPDREVTPVPEEAVPRDAGGREAQPAIEAVVHSFSVNTAAVDLENITQIYSGISLFERLQFIIDHCPPLRRDAIICLINALQQDSLDANRYSTLHAQLESMERMPNEQNMFPMPAFEQSWVDHTSIKASGRLDVLLCEYKKQKDEGVKESTRRAMEDLFQHYLVSGKYLEGLRLFGRGMREYCSQFKHIIHMWLSWLELTICAGEWCRVEPLVAQAERSIADAEESEQVGNGSSRAGRAALPAVVGTKNNRQLITSGKAKLDAISGLCRMQNGRYKAAAEKLVKVDVDQFESPWLLHSSDIAVYSTLSVLATHERMYIKKKVLGDPICRKFLEAEPRLVELLQCFVGSQFGRCFDLLGSLKDTFMLDPFISQHITPLFDLIRQRAMIQYLIPFATAKLTEMANIFRTTVAELEDELVSLIEKGELSARIDSVAGLIRIVGTDQRQDTYRQIVETCDSMLERTETTIMRAVIQQSRMSISGEPRNKRKGAHNSDEASEPIGTAPNRPKVTTLAQGMIRVLKGQPRVDAVATLSEVDSSEGSEDPKEPEQ